MERLSALQIPVNTLGTVFLVESGTANGPGECVKSPAAAESTHSHGTGQVSVDIHGLHLQAQFRLLYKRLLLFQLLIRPPPPNIRLVVALVEFVHC